jgi:hypothetical protein
MTADPSVLNRRIVVINGIGYVDYIRFRWAPHAAQAIRHMPAMRGATWRYFASPQEARARLGEWGVIPAKNVRHLADAPADVLASSLIKE